MALTSDTSRSPAEGGYACNGSVVNFAGTFRILGETRIRVIKTEVATLNEVELTLGTGDDQYSVAPTGGSYPADTFTVTTVDTYSADYTIAILRDEPFTQPASYGNSGPYLPKNHETSYDKLTMQTQELNELVSRCIRFPAGQDPATYVIVLDDGDQVIYTQLQDGSVTTAKLSDNAVTYAKMQNVSATDKLLGRSTAGAGDVEEIACTAAGRALLDDASASAQRTTLGLGDSSTKDVGTIAGTVAAGDDSRFTDVVSGKVLHAVDQQANTTAGQALTATTWNKARLGTVVQDTSGASIASDVLTLVSGQAYRITFRACMSHSAAATTITGLAKLRQTSGTPADIAFGNPVSMYGNFNSTGNAWSVATVDVTPDANHTYELQIYPAAAGPTGGTPASVGEVETYHSIFVEEIG